MAHPREVSHQYHLTFITWLVTKELCAIEYIGSDGLVLPPHLLMQRCTLRVMRATTYSYCLFLLRSSHWLVVSPSGPFSLWCIWVLVITWLVTKELCAIECIGSDSEVRLNYGTFLIENIVFPDWHCIRHQELVVDAPKASQICKHLWESTPCMVIVVPCELPHLFYHLTLWTP